MSIHIPYGKGHIECGIPYDGLLTSRIDTLKSDRPGVEIVEEAVENAAENAERNGITNAHFFVGDATDTRGLLASAEDELGRKISPTVVVLDPPRAGCDSELIDFVAEMNPKRVVYVSCNPQTLARDVKAFGEYGYTTERVAGWDMFALTGHVESFVCLTR